MRTLFTILILFTSVGSRAESIPVQLRLFGSVASVEPRDLNEELEANSLKTIDSVMRGGIEVTYPLTRFLDVGVRYSKLSATRDEKVTNDATDYSVELDQDLYTLIARVPVFKSKYMKLDAFTGFGGTNTTVNLKSSSQEGELSSKSVSGWYGSPVSMWGGSLALGYSKFFVVVEVGKEFNKVDRLESTGTVNSNVNEILLSGSYVSFGLIFDGVEAKK